MKGWFGAVGVMAVVLAGGGTACANSIPLFPDVANTLLPGDLYDTGSVQNGGSVPIDANYYFTVPIGTTSKSVETTFEPTGGDNLGILNATLSWYFSSSPVGPLFGPQIQSIAVTDGAGVEVGLLPTMIQALAGPGFYDLVVTGTTESNGGNYDLSVRASGGTDSSSTPIPGALVLFGTVFGAGSLLMRRRRNRGELAAAAV
jgi:hypothetical protein